MVKKSSIFFSIFMVLAFCSGSFADFTAINISDNNEVGDFSPQLNNNDQMVWVGFDNPDTPNTHVYFYDGSTPNIISDDNTDTVWAYADPQINTNGDVVWRSGPPTDGSILYYDGSTLVNISNPIKVELLGYPKINDNGDVVWAGGLLYSEIYYYDRSTPSVSAVKISDNPDNNDKFPQINNHGDVVWLSDKIKAGVDRDNEIYYYDRSAEEPEQKVKILSSTNSYNEDESVQINDNGHVVWSGKSASSDAKSDIFYYNGETVINISNSPGVIDRDPQINNNNQIVWHAYPDMDLESDSEIYCYDGATATLTNISNNTSFKDFAPQINANGNVTWYGVLVVVIPGDEPSYETTYKIFYYDGTSVTSIFTDQNIAMAPQINDINHVTWLTFNPLDMSTAEVYFAEDLDADYDEDGFSKNEGDCDDTNAAINPDATEIPFPQNFVDENCDGKFCFISMVNSGSTPNMTLIVLLLGTGLVGLVGSRSKFKK